MKRKNIIALGNILIGLGLIMMISSVGYSIITQFIEAELSTLFSHGAVMGIFIGAILWLIGARVGGQEEITDRYWWARRIGKRHREKHS